MDSTSTQTLTPPTHIVTPSPRDVSQVTTGWHSGGTIEVGEPEGATDSDGSALAVAVGALLLKLGGADGSRLGDFEGMRLGSMLAAILGATLGASLSQGPHSPSPLSNSSRTSSSGTQTSAAESMQMITPDGSGPGTGRTTGPQRSMVTHSSGSTSVGALVGCTEVVGCDDGADVVGALDGSGTTSLSVGLSVASGLGRLLGLGLIDGTVVGTDEGAGVGHTPQSAPIESM